MFDFHLHTTVSSDATGTAEEMAAAAKLAGLTEICFTDHYDFNSDPTKRHDLFSLEKYSEAYDSLHLDGLKILRGVEFGLTTWNQNELKKLCDMRKFDFVIGSVHTVDGYDPYQIQYWEGLTVKEAYVKYMLAVLDCVKVHDGFDVLGHLTYVCKAPYNPDPSPLLYRDYKDVADEVMRTLASKGIGMEINTSGVGRVGDFLPSKEYLQRFKELGGEIVTVGSDAHFPSRVGEHTNAALEILKDVFGYVCTFEDRKPVFHKL